VKVNKLDGVGGGVLRSGSLLLDAALSTVCCGCVGGGCCKRVGVASSVPWGHTYSLRHTVKHS